jgi:hypothetical protein
MCDPTTETLVASPTPDPRRVRFADGRVFSVPAGWALLPPGDAGLTRRVKATGPSWTVQEKVGRRLFGRGVWAPAAQVEAARAALEAERGTEAHQRKLARGRARRSAAQDEYVARFEAQVLGFLRFAQAFARQAEKLAALVTTHATPVGSGTVARTERLPVEQRASAAVIAWMRHQTTAYDDLSIARVKGARRQVRRDLAEQSRALLELHRAGRAHPAACPLCKALE